MTKFHISIGAAPNKSLNLDQDIRLVKAALLYADFVTLYSMQFALLSSLSHIYDLPALDKLALVESVISYLNINGAEQKDHILAFKKLDLMLRGKWPGSHRKAVEREVNSRTKPHFDSVILQLLKDAKFEEIKKLESLNLLQIHNFEQTVDKNKALDSVRSSIILGSRKPIRTKDQKQIQGEVESFILELMEQLISVIGNPATYPIFDDPIGDFVNELVKAGELIPSSASESRSRHVGLASSLLQRLPLFDSASIDEIVDIRSELEGPLVRFRKAIIDYSEQIENASWDKDFVSDADKVFSQQIEPVVQEIEEFINSNTYLKSLSERLPGAISTSFSPAILGLVISQNQGLPDLLMYGLGLYSGVNLSNAFYEALKDWKDEQRKIERNNLYFYYEVGKNLEANRQDKNFLAKMRRKK